MAKLNTSSRKADGKAAPIDTQKEHAALMDKFNHAIEEIATSAGDNKRKTALGRKDITGFLKSGLLSGMSPDAFEAWKLTIKCRYMAFCLTAAGYPATYDAVISLWPHVLPDGSLSAKVNAKLHGETLAKIAGVNDPTLYKDWQDNAFNCANTGMKFLSNCFADAGLDIKTNAAKVEEAAPTSNANAGQGSTASPEGNSSDPKTAGETIRTATPNDIAAALATLPEDVFAQVIGEAAGLRIAKGCTKIANSHFVTALLVARDARNQENATPATKCA